MSRLRRFRTCWGQQCSHCLQMLPFDQFHRQRGKPNGYRSHCKECRNKTYSENYATEAGRRTAQVNSWRSQGIKDMTIARYEEMVLDQNGRCAICQVTAEENGRRLCVDHDHETGRVRALLCDHCNVGIGRFNDSPEMLEKALRYLQHHTMEVAQQCL